MHDLIVVGGGAAGVFAAISAKEKYPAASVTLLEKSAVLLSKVRVSGGGRCNVTHSCFEPQKLVHNYPRGEKELLGPFHRFQPKDTIAWFESNHVQLKTEPDGRMFPITDDSETIIHCLLQKAKKLGVTILTRQRINTITHQDTHFILSHNEGSFETKNLILATGNSPEGHSWAKFLGHSIQDPVPSLFTFNVPTSPLKELSGISVPYVTVKLKDSSYAQSGPILITHFGFSGPSVLKLSAWAARYLHSKNYCVEILINWLPAYSKEEILSQINSCKQQSPQKFLSNENPFDFPKNLWKALLGTAFEKRMADIPNKEIQALAEKLQSDSYQVNGKTTNKEEFVTCGGVNLKEINFKTMESKICPHLFFAGEILDIDGVTGGFNFQNAWTTGFIAGSSIVF